MAKKIKLVYILGASHSGTTLTAMLIGAHPEICTVGELKVTSLGDLTKYRCSCHKKILDCGFWQNITKSMTDKGTNFDLENPGTDYKSCDSSYVKKLLKPLHRSVFLEMIRDIALSLSPTWRKCYRRIQKQNTNLLKSISEQTGNDIIVDSSKIGIRLKYLLKNPDIDVYVVRVVRDGRGVLLTYVNPSEFADSQNPELRQGGMGGNREDEKIPFDKAMHEWMRSNMEAEEVLKTVADDRKIKIKYEELCLNTQETLKTIFEFIGVDSNRMNMDFKSVDHHVIGNGMRLDTSSKINLDERWKEILTQEQLKEFEEIAGNLNKGLGYIN